ncbi:hypothetical protein DICVIV_11843 [Dictyocaulus viviparus]|uniref:Uncharacterized protein n=1 Tax=Dictyocaulus viviparus TaxID=29172 RepID=A0A0D8XET7_DICVI|nr:hypothetical protein DICVIV_11843 [Dictyocaulus viviparus]
MNVAWFHQSSSDCRGCGETFKYSCVATFLLLSVCEHHIVKTHCKAGGNRYSIFETISSVIEADAICEALEKLSFASSLINVKKSEQRIFGIRKNGFGISCTDPGINQTLLESVLDIGEFKEIFVYRNSGKSKEEHLNWFQILLKGLDE